MRERRAKGQRTRDKGRVKRLGRMVFLILTFILTPLAFIFVFWWFRGWNGKDPAQVVIVAKETLWILAIRPDEHRMVQIQIPGNVMIDVAGHGSWQARALPGLADLEQNQRILGSIGRDLLGVPVDGVIATTEWRRQKEISYYWLLGEGLSSARNVFNCMRVRCSTAFWSFPEEVRLVLFVNSLRPPEFTDIDLSRTTAARRIVDPSGSEFFQMDQEILSSFGQQWFSVDAFRLSGLTIAVHVKGENRTMGRRLGRMLENLGLRVISISNNASDREKSLIVQNPELRMHPVVKRLARWLELPIRVGAFDERADILVVP